MTYLNKKRRRGQQSVARDEGHDTNAENQPGMENRPLGRRRIRTHAPQRRVLRHNPRPLQTPRTTDETTLTNEAIQQGIQRLYASYNQCVARVTQADDRFEQFRAAIRHDALKWHWKCSESVRTCNIRDKGWSESGTHYLTWCKKRWIT